MKGSYILLLKLNKPRQIFVGNLGISCFTEGSYAYVGSALNGLEARVSRHSRLNKKHHWHIDYLLDWSYIYEVVLIPGEGRLRLSLN
jgi:Uri superfamily endonuclease